MSMKLFDSELSIMEILWREGDTTAKRIAEITKETIGWSKTTTYTIIKKCLDKGAIERHDPNFVCRALVSQEQVQEYETTELINKMYNGAPDKLVASLLGQKRLTSEEISNLKQLIERLQ
ncbi:BlaI/MecI/CopY family transcriptional regulator [Paenibacillus sp. GSMTC-2017]|uniref:BlaI/MecI/CopY family transcriptional regulator n=1 Tax=Paenibacillus sp. GSMTC-2017 TaxID=2794350 RepID=UPI0018DA1D39|nr:BlaI/MecI/CopY family transcriptional regulator [Paenibacillus sp. GSMTC-2017]MBH5316390.1 BlaI/MecI/CopY family transcriptional regulator [Paenibacillus sp. GSMTC-2017]